jgi:hypothetical protein
MPFVHRIHYLQFYSDLNYRLMSVGETNSDSGFSNGSGGPPARI